MRETVNGHFLFWLKKAPVRAGGSSLLPPESPRGFSSLARLYYLRAQPKPSCYAGYKHIKLLYWPTLTVGGCLSSVNLHWYAIDFFFQKTNALIALWENRLIKYYLLFNRGYVVLISVQPWPDIEEFSFKVLVLKVLFAFHWFRMSEKRNRVIIR